MPAPNPRAVLALGLFLTAIAAYAAAPAESITQRAALAAITPRSPFLEPSAGRRWFRGNTHTHTVNSDGDSTADEVVRWYREQKTYQFLVLTDHNFLTSVDGLNALHGADSKFLVIRGEEISDKFGDKPLHINGLDLKSLVTPQGGSSVSDILTRNVAAIRKAEGIPHINHPNFMWAITGADLKQVKNNTLFEVFNGHPTVNNAGGGGVPGLEELWDDILTSGQEIYGIAVDDAHVFKRPWDAAAARPGQGWVVVRSATLDPRAVVTALDRGEFYASNGVALDDVAVTKEGLTVTIKEAPTTKYRTQFVGRGGKVLKEVIANPAVYTFTGDETYVRARVLDSNGKTAWVQPVFLSGATSSR
jgi:hypothetical protein